MRLTSLARAAWRPDHRRGFAAGILCGLILVYAARFGVNHSTIPDWLVSPLLLEDTVGTADAIVVMGAGVIGDCVPNQNGVRRVLRAAALWREGRAPVLVFTGGTGGTCPVAVAMSRLAREVGVPDASILLETGSRNTYENGERSAPLLRAIGARRVLVVTDRLHMPRAAATLAHFGFSVERAAIPIYEGHSDNVSMLSAGAREMLALTYYRFRGWLDLPDPRSGPPTASQGAGTRDSGHAMRHAVKNPAGPLVVIGASYAEGWIPSQLASVPVINRGVAGEQSFEMLARFERDVVSVQPRAVIVWGFVNDLSRASGETDAALLRVRASYTAMVEVARRHGVEPILATEVTLRPPNAWSERLAAWVGPFLGKESYQDRINKSLIETNAWLQDLAGREGLLILDFRSVLSGPDGRRRPEYAQDDGSHITPAGYAALTAYAAPRLAQHLLRTGA